MPLHLSELADSLFLEAILEFAVPRWLLLYRQLCRGQRPEEPWASNDCEAAHRALAAHRDVGANFT